MGRMRGRHVDGRAIRALREKQGVRQVQFAELANISPRYLKEVEGRVNQPDAPTRQPSAVVVHRIANALGVDIDEFTTPTDEDSAAVA